MIELGSFALKNATQMSKSYLNTAEKFAEQDVQRCLNYLEAANIAIIGLEQEHDQILVQLRNCKPNQAEEKQAIGKRIDEYLTVDKLLPELQKAVVGIENSRKSLQKSADSFVQLPGSKKKRQEAVAKLSLLAGKLTYYMSTLIGEDSFRLDIEVTHIEDKDQSKRVKSKPITGVEWESLNDIESHIRSTQIIETSNSNDFLQRVEEIYLNRNKDMLRQLPVLIENVSNVLRTAFR